MCSPHVRRLRILGSAVLAIAYVACGRLDAFFHLHLQPWDLAAAWLLVEEAGGLCTAWAGVRSQLEDREIVAAPPDLHAALSRPAGPPARGRAPVMRPRLVILGLLALTLWGGLLACDSAPAPSGPPATGTAASPSPTPSSTAVPPAPTPAATATALPTVAPTPTDGPVRTPVGGAAAAEFTAALTAMDLPRQLSLHAATPTRRAGSALRAHRHRRLRSRPAAMTPTSMLSASTPRSA